jgi:hypothetical protein
VWWWEPCLENEQAKGEFVAALACVARTLRADRLRESQLSRICHFCVRLREMSCLSRVRKNTIGIGSRYWWPAVRGNAVARSPDVYSGVETCRRRQQKGPARIDRGGEKPTVRVPTCQSERRPVKGGYPRLGTELLVCPTCHGIRVFTIEGM